MYDDSLCWGNPRDILVDASPSATTRGDSCHREITNSWRTDGETHTAKLRELQRSTFAVPPHGTLDMFVFGSARARLLDDTSFAANEGISKEVERIHVSEERTVLCAEGSRAAEIDQSFTSVDFPVLPPCFESTLPPHTRGFASTNWVSPACA